MLSADGRVRATMYYDSLDLAAGQLISAAAWASHHILALGFSNGDCLLAELQSAAVSKTLLSGQLGVQALLSGIGLLSNKNNPCGAVLAVSYIAGTFLSLSQDGTLALWNVSGRNCVERLNLRSLLNSPLRRVRAALMTSSCAGSSGVVALGFAFDRGSSEMESCSWNVRRYYSYSGCRCDDVTSCLCRC
jgi:hypothetical protein